MFETEVSLRDRESYCLGGDELARTAGVDIQTALGALHLAAGAGFVELIDGVPHAYRFAHALIRETLYDEIPTPDRLRLHGRAGEALAALSAAHDQSRLSRIAHHFFQSAALGNASQAADYAARAGHEAMRLDAYEEAAIQYGNVIDVLKRYGRADDERIRQAVFWKCRALTGTGEVDEAVPLLAESIESCDLAADTVDWLADVSTLWVILTSCSAQTEQLPLLRKFIARLPEGDSAARAKLLAAQAFAERTLGVLSRVPALVEDSLDMARRIGDPAVLSHCFRSSLLALHGEPDKIERRIALGAEFIRVSPAEDHCERLAEAFYLQALNLVEAGRIDDLERLLGDYESLPAAGLGLHEYRTKALRILISLLAGEYAGLAERIEALRAFGQKSRGEDAEGVYAAQMFMLHRDLGKLGAFGPIIERFATSPAQRAWTPGLMLALVEIGKPDAAARELERLSIDRFSAIPHDGMRATALVYCAETCATLGDAERARVLYELLSPYAGTFACHPTAVSFGSMELYLGMLPSLPQEKGESEVALFIIERNFAQQIDPTAEELKAIGAVNEAVGVCWIYSFLSADKRKTYCLYEAQSAEAIREAARRAGLPADVVIELAGEIRPEDVLARTA